MDLIAKTPADRRVAEIVEPVVVELGFDLVRVRVSGSRRTKLQIMAERSDGSMDIDDCATLSRSLSPVLDAADPLGAPYVLEISSPGIDRPLTREADFDAFAGFPVRIETRDPVEGRRRFRGDLLGLRRGADGISVALRESTRGEEIALRIEALAEARIVPDPGLFQSALAHASKEG